MIIYNYDPTTFEFLGESQAFRNPARPNLTGPEAYLLPAYATFTKPPKIGKNKTAIFNEKENTWTIIEDYRSITVYNVETRQPIVWNELGAIPETYTLKLKKSLTEELAKAMMLVKQVHEACLDKLIHFEEYDLDFKYTKMANINAQAEQNFPFSRDENNKIYTLTDEQLKQVKEFLVIYGQLAYIQKWKLEASLSKCKTCEKIENLSQTIKIEVDLNLVKDLQALDEEKRKNYYQRLINDFNK